MQEAQRLDGVSYLDTIDGLVDHLDPVSYGGGADPIILGLEVSESSVSDEEDGSERKSSAASHDISADPSIDDMEGVQEFRRGKKRGHERWEGRWESAEQRENKAIQSHAVQDIRAAYEVPQEVSKADFDRTVEEERRALRINIENLGNTAGANQQIEARERFQQQQDKEHEAQRAAK